MKEVIYIREFRLIMSMNSRRLGGKTTLTFKHSLFYMKNELVSWLIVCCTIVVVLF